MVDHHETIKCIYISLNISVKVSSPNYYTTLNYIILVGVKNLRFKTYIAEKVKKQESNKPAC